jgi:hypothetical protein
MDMRQTSSGGRRDDVDRFKVNDRRDAPKTVEACRHVALREIEQKSHCWRISPYCGPER